MNLIGSIFLRIKYGLILDKPQYLVRLFKNIILVKIFKKQKLRGVDFSIGYLCNLKCKHCFAEVLKSDHKTPLTLDDYKRVVKEAMALGAITFSLQGGEVLIIPDYEKIIKACQPQKNSVVITTNGTKINESAIRKLKKLGVNCINFSLDSSSPHEHDKFRGMNGLYNKVISGIELCLKLGMNVTINTAVSSSSINSQGFKDLLELSNKYGILMNTLFAAPVGNWKGNLSVLMSKNDLDKYYQLRKKYPLVVRDLDNNYNGPGCGGLKELIYITNYGDVLGCPFIHISLGNVKKHSLDFILKNGKKKLKFFNAYHSKCWISEERTFIDNYLKSINDKSLPITINEYEENN